MIILYIIGAITLITLIKWLYEKVKYENILKNAKNKPYENNKEKRPKTQNREIYSYEEYKGEQGEKIVKRYINQYSSKYQTTINNYVTKAENNMTCQVDHIVIKENGVFVIETKNYEGMIFGAKEQRKWTQVLAGGHVKNQFYNPIKQNATHLYNIRRIIGERIPIYSLIVFPRADVSRVIEIDEICEINKMIRKLATTGEKVLSQEKIEEIKTKLESKREQISNTEHIENIEHMKENIRNDICPRCGGQLLIRHSKNGDFKGCINYPSCKFTKKI